MSAVVFACNVSHGRIAGRSFKWHIKHVQIFSLYLQLYKIRVSPSLSMRCPKTFTVDFHRWIHDYQDACVDKLERFMRGEMNTKGDGHGRYAGAVTPGTPSSTIGGRGIGGIFQRSSSHDNASDRECNGTSQVNNHWCFQRSHEHWIFTRFSIASLHISPLFRLCDAFKVFCRFFLIFKCIV